jgi:hypothetical protein
MPDGVILQLLWYNNGLNMTGDKRKRWHVTRRLFLTAQYPRADQEGACLWTGGYHQKYESGFYEVQRFFCERQR